MSMEWADEDEGPSRGSSWGIQRLRAPDGALVSWLHMYPTVHAVDPGGDTGIATVWFDRELLLRKDLPLQKALLAWEAECLFGTENFMTLQALRWISERSHSPAAVVIEDFVLQSFLPGREVLSPVRIGHKLDYQLWRGIKAARGGKRTYDVSWQSANDAKHTVTDPRLKGMAMYTPGPDHARDATRHAILWLKRYRQRLFAEGA